MSAYSEKLRDPRWQKARLKVMERDGWKCQICDADTVTLAVHHRFYESGKAPWDYPLTALRTLCEECHTEEHELWPDEERTLIREIKRAGASTSEVNRLYIALNKAGLLNEEQWNQLLYAIEDELKKMQGEDHA